MYFFFASREAIIRLLPPSLRLCEVGVQKGAFTRTLISTNPSELHLVDPWEHQADDLYLRDAANVDDGAHAQNLAEVTRLFGSDKRVKLHRGYSRQMLPNFVSGSLDAMYIDGNHTYQAVLDDLLTASNIVHDEGLLMGHDFCSHWRSRQGGFGVIGAVLEFCKITGADFFGLTCSEGLTDHTTSFSTYFLAKKPSAGLKQKLLRRVHESNMGLVDLPLSIVGAYNHTVVPCGDGRHRYIPSFSM